MTKSPQMNNALSIRCDCGTVRGRLLLESGRGRRVRVNRGVCYCTDCQAFARHLGHANTLDEDGGTEILQLSSGRVRIDRGAESLVCLQLTEGALMRWYAGCCKTPIANTLTRPWIPFAGVISSCLDSELSAEDIDGAVGPIRIRVHTSGALTDPDRLAQQGQGAAAMLFGLLGVMGKGWLNRDQRKSPFFGTGGEAIATPAVLTAAELANAKSA